MIKIFCDGVFDLFHDGHVKHFCQIKKKYPNSYLMVGVLNDKITSEYKRVPIFNEIKRLELISSCKYVDEATLNYPVIMTEEFMNENSIDLVIHAFANKNDLEKQKKYFEVPIKLNKMEIIEYNSGISTTNLINLLETNESIINSNKDGWDKIWELKGNENSTNLRVLNGYENTTFDSNKSYEEIKSRLGIQKDDKIIEFGCGAGQFSKLFDNESFNYFGIDYSQNLVLKNIHINNSKVFNCRANQTPFKDKYFDFAFCIGVFEYFPSKEYAYEVIKEMERVTKNKIYILNIRSGTHNEKKSKHKYEGCFKHIVYKPTDFPDFQHLVSTYENDVKFSIIKDL
jgi:cytidyltransferase-like protein